MNTNRIVDKLGEMSVTGTWIWFHTNRYGAELMLELVKYRIDVYGDFEISDDYKKFRKIPSARERMPKHNDMTYHLEFYQQTTEQYDYDHLPEPKYTEENKKVKRRAT